MPRLLPVRVKLTDAEREELRILRYYEAKRRYWLRAEIVIRAGAGQNNLFIARRLGISRNTVKHWRRRFARERVAGLRDRPIPGRPRKAVTVEAVGTRPC